MRVLVTGPREFKSQYSLFAALTALHPTAVIHGGARGADTLAGIWAQGNGVEEVRVVYPDHLGKAGGVLRNQYMLDHKRPDIVLACPWDNDSGTLDCVKRALAMGVPVVRLVDGL